MQASRRQLCLTICLAFSNLILPFAALAQTGAPVATSAPLPPEAQDALKKGIIAAQQQDYLLAIRFFQDARKAAPKAPVIYYDLGLAESKIPGRELRAIAWFSAYLAANPRASNAAAVKDQIDALDVKNQGNLAHLIQTAQDAASKIPPPKSTAGLIAASEIWADTGNVAAAVECAKLIQDDPVSGTRERNRSFAYIAEVQAKAGDVAGAQLTTGLIHASDSKSEDMSDTAGPRDEARAAIAEAQATAGDMAGAQSTVSIINGGIYRDGALLEIARVQANSGNLAGAQRTASLIPDSGWNKIDAQELIAKAQADAGDLAGAQTTAGLIPANDYRKREVKEYISQAQTKRGSTVENAGNDLRMSFYDWVQILDVFPLFKTPPLVPCSLNVDGILDLAASLKSMPSSDTPEKMLEPFLTLIRLNADAQICVAKMLKQQTKRLAQP